VTYKSASRQATPRGAESTATSSAWRVAHMSAFVRCDGTIRASPEQRSPGGPRAHSPGTHVPESQEAREA
jgi:hypothetical protein